MRLDTILREKVQSIIDAVKMEVTEEWENKTHKP